MAYAFSSSSHFSWFKHVLVMIVVMDVTIPAEGLPNSEMSHSHSGAGMAMFLILNRRRFGFTVSLFEGRRPHTLPACAERGKNVSVVPNSSRPVIYRLLLTGFSTFTVGSIRDPKST